MKAIILKCRTGSRFHLGEYANHKNTVLHNTSEYIHSDVLFGAFISALSKIYPEKLNDFRQLFGEGEIRFSSAFYCIEENSTNKNLYLLPKPASLNFIQLNEHIDPKKVKKIKFISKGIYEKGITPLEWFSEKCVIPDDKCVFLKEEFDENDSTFSLYDKVDLQKARIHTSEPENNLYSQTDIVLMGSDNYQVNWYFLLDLNNQLSKEDIDIFYQTLDLMAINGIGGERSTGCGAIEEMEVIDNFCLNPDQPSNQQLLLSLAFPKEAEKDKYLYYKTKIRGGMWYGIKNDQRLNLLMGIEEGSILNDKISSQIIDLSENNNHSWQYGGNITIPLPSEYFNFLNN